MEKWKKAVIGIAIAFVVMIFVIPPILEISYYQSVQQRSDQLGEGGKISDKFGTICLTKDYQSWDNTCKPGTGFKP